MTLHIFKYSNNQAIKGLTSEKEGGNLPVNSDVGYWKYWKTINIYSNVIKIVGLAPFDEILSAIEKDGYYINNILISIYEI